LPPAPFFVEGARWHRACPSQRARSVPTGTLGADGRARGDDTEKAGPDLRRDRPSRVMLLLGERSELRVVGVRLGSIVLGHELRREQVGRDDLHTVVVL